MTDPQQTTPAPSGVTPDVAFKLGADDPTRAAPASAAAASSDPSAPQQESATPPPDPVVAEPAIEDQAGDLARRIAHELAVAGPEGWQRYVAVFALTTVGGVRTAVYYDEADRAAQLEPAEEVLELVRWQRDISARLGDGPWWRMTIQFDVGGRLSVDYDYGDEPFPEEHLFVPDAYRADLERYPRRRLPMWLAAYLGHDDRQSRTPQQAAAQARADQAAGVGAVRSVDDFPVLPVLWARWASIAAAFVAVGSDWGPRILPSVGVFEGSARSGATLYVLPGDRAVLSGGVWNAPELDAAYNDGAPQPRLYAGAPDWVANQVLNPRAGRGLLSFCYWWEGGSWYRGEAPGAEQLSPAVPGIWTAQTVTEVVCGVLSDDPSDEIRSAAATLVAAAEAGVVTRDTLAALFTDPNDDIDGALYQLSLAGLVTTVPEALSRDRAVTLVAAHIRDQGVDTADYPLDELVAERLSVGWMVFVPTRPGEIAIGRAVFYIADDGVIEQSSSSVAPAVYAAGFEERFRRRRTGAPAEFSV